ncbi:unnamed protein product [Lactuca virosa]|uniref:Uncharacterized protein n=1 Tax=Lactuca virosa TaxID=75947 RepID=A0AAU9MNI0_9ASTR|nr:unnamed protein product [Lactuca virosa]
MFGKTLPSAITTDFTTWATTVAGGTTRLAAADAPHQYSTTGTTTTAGSTQSFDPLDPFLFQLNILILAI